MHNNVFRKKKKRRCLWLVLLILPSMLLMASCQQTPVLPAPEQIAVAPDGDALYVSWTPVEGADCYYVYRSPDTLSDYTYWGVTRYAELHDRTVAADTGYSYKVFPALTDGDRYYRADSSIVSGSGMVLSAPSIYSVTTAESGCTVKWSPVITASGYSLYRASEPDGEYARIASLDGTEYTDVPQSRSTQYYYRVAAAEVDTGVESALSAAVGSLTAPVMKSVTRQDTFTAVLSWFSRDKGVEYAIYRADKPDGEYACIGVADNVCSFHDTGISYGTDYYYKIETKLFGDHFRVSSGLSQPMQIKEMPTSSLLVLMYHNFVSEEDVANGVAFSEYSIYPDEFEGDLRYFKTNGYTTVNAEELLACIKGEREFPEKPVMISIDDGTRGVYRYAYPLLQKYGMKAVLSVIGENIDLAEAEVDRSLNPDPYCTWAELAEMAASGTVELASHSYSLHKFEPNGRVGVSIKSSETAADYEALIFPDLEKLNDKLFSLTGKKPVAFAYPYSYRSDETDALLTKDFGFGLLLGGDDCRVTQMNHFIIGENDELQSPLLNRIPRMNGRTTGGYFRRANEHDYPTLEALAAALAEKLAPVETPFVAPATALPSPVGGAGAAQPAAPSATPAAQ